MNKDKNIQTVIEAATENVINKHLKKDGLAYMPLYEGEMRSLLKQLHEDKISIGKIVEIINKKVIRRAMFSQFGKIAVCYNCTGTGEILNTQCVTCKGHGKILVVPIIQTT